MPREDGAEAGQTLPGRHALAIPFVLDVHPECPAARGAQVLVLGSASRLCPSSIQGSQMLEITPQSWRAVERAPGQVGGCPPRDHLLLAGEEEEEDARSLDAVHGRGPGSRLSGQQPAQSPAFQKTLESACFLLLLLQFSRTLECLPRDPLQQ
ncbi:hypothetical protein E2I00_013545 [Balaenoptera physalus]|uniref:Uncharacterized protein n=1 Tax=Balaenoptera physalus TaxID=9770 RepID=A0A6A1QDA0_BALPH|nr:hypothetical protein E2I00_013545 [Balaenoptera physalus]